MLCVLLHSSYQHQNNVMWGYYLPLIAAFSYIAWIMITSREQFISGVKISPNFWILLKDFSFNLKKKHNLVHERPSSLLLWVEDNFIHHTFSTMVKKILILEESFDICWGLLSRSDFTLPESSWLTSYFINSGYG